MAGSRPPRSSQKSFRSDKSQTISIRRIQSQASAIPPNTNSGNLLSRAALLRKLKTRKRVDETIIVPTSSSLNPTSFSIVLPIPPSINQQYATVNGRRVLSSTGRRYKTSTAQTLLSALTQSPHRNSFLRAIHSHYLALSIHFSFPTLLRRDLDGGLKIAQDSLCEALGINDNRIVEIHLYKTLDRDHPRLECTLSITRPLPAAMRQRVRRRPAPKRRSKL